MNDKSKIPQDQLSSEAVVAAAGEVASDTPPASTGVAKSSAIFGGMTLLSRLAGFARDVVVTAALGASAGPAADAYYTALNFPNLFRRIFAEGAFAAAFVPAYSRRLKAEGPDAADQVATDALAVLATITVALTIVAQLAMPWLMAAINIGFLDDPQRYKLAVMLTQITMPYLPCMAIAALLSGVLNARGRFLVSGAYPILLNVIMLAAIWPVKGDPIATSTFASWSVVVAGIAQAGLCWWAVRKAGANVRIRLPRLTPAVKAIIITAIPAAIGNSATQINVFISGNLSSLVNGGRTWLATADRLYQLPLGLVGVAIGIALLPRLSSAVATANKGEQQSSMDEAMILSMALTLPAATALMSMPLLLVEGLFLRDAFLAYDAQNTAAALLQFGWGVPAFVLIRVLAPAFYARSDSKTPMRYALVSVVVNAVLAVALFFGGMGVSGIAAAVSAAAWANALLLAAKLWRHDYYRPSKHAIDRLVRILVSSIGMGVIVAGCSLFRPSIEAPIADVLAMVGTDHGVKELAMLLVVALGGLSYVVLAFATRAITPRDIRRLLRRGA
ncbi:murein biosynthesis integral membrane protein MurJ [uncultured Brevundimonas sp.]|uniref:murein biosynthesis integral membrane protein MurJ n=1 Tax=uncultured Brevundimonas sp. TaxID=213418 RepID=UPI00260D1B72|nr:murein biosynthesis integral membrane protein MurJ [uncultured Brevundimonas sp.]